MMPTMMPNAPTRWALRAYSGRMRIATGILGIVVALFGLLWALQGFGVVGGSPMSNTTTWSVIGPIVAVIGVALTFVAFRRRKP
jgi:hypothetical protein